MTIVDRIFELFQERGGAAYFGEPVSQLEHALQAAALAEQSRAAESLIVAALLHDVGHLLHGRPETIADEGIDARHETVGESWLCAHFSPAVTEPVRLHVAAKRYLCCVDRAYLAQLSPASMQSLELQGGAFTAGEARAFEANPFFRDAVDLRRWDDAAKVQGLDVPGLEHYREMFSRHRRSPDLPDTPETSADAGAHCR